MWCNFLVVALSIAGFSNPIYVREACGVPILYCKIPPVTDDKPILVNFKDLSNDWSPAIICELHCKSPSFISVFLHILGLPRWFPVGSCVNLLGEVKTSEILSTVFRLHSKMSFNDDHWWETENQVEKNTLLASKRVLEVSVVNIFCQSFITLLIP